MSQSTAVERDTETIGQVSSLEDEWQEPPRRRRAGRRVVVGLVIVAVLAGVLWLVKGMVAGSEVVEDLTATVRKETLVLSVTEGGTLQSRDSVEVRCMVEGRTTILWIVDEGKYVKKGDKLVELDASDLQTRIDGQQIAFENADSSYLQATESLEIQKNQNDSNLKSAELDVLFAQMDLDKYDEGDWPQQLLKAKNDIIIADEEYRQAKVTLEWTEKLYQDKFVNKTELDKDKLSVTKTQLALELRRNELDVLQKHTRPKRLKELQSIKDEAIKNLERVKRKAASELARAEADLKTKKSLRDLQLRKLEKLKKQLTQTVMVAPKGGLVVYANERNYWRSQQLIEEGADVRERQKLIELPDTTQMDVETKVHESVIDQVHIGMVARVLVDAFSDQPLTGHVTKVALLPDPVNRFMNPDLKVYRTTIELDEPLAGLKPGMSAEVTIQIDTIAGALVVPVQTVTTHKGKPACFLPSGGEPEPRLVKVGRSNDKLVEIVEGLKEGEQVLLTPPREEGILAEKERKAGQKQAGGKKRATASQPTRGGRGTAGGRRRPGGAARAGGQGQAHGSAQMTEAQRKFKEKYDKASPAEKKRMLQQYKKQQMQKAAAQRKAGR